ncbi:MAG: glycosyltransferase family 4 protein, partial [Chloroflexota bacterium]|nr:glycosyltransferase family 4 protein [Chloroflexota bacterium]
LAIGLDETVVRKPGEVSSDSLQRQLKYASVLESYQFIARTLGGSRDRVQLADNFWVYPTASHNRLTFVSDAVRIGSRICQTEQVDVISTQDPFATGLVGYVLKRRFGIPLSLQFAGDMVNNSYFLRERWFYPLMNALARWLIRQADTFRVVSVKEKHKLVNMGVPAERIWNLGWITGFGAFLQADGAIARKRLLGQEFTALVLFAGRLVPQKDLPNLIGAMQRVIARHPQALLVMAGTGPEADVARRLARDLGVERNVTWLGAVPYEEIPAYFAACDLFVLPSVYEGNARVLAEAAAAGKPVVSTDVSGTQDTVIDGETGYIVPVGQPEGLAQGVIRLLDDPARAVEMGRRAREHVLALYDEQRLLAGFAELWEETAELREL